MSSNTKQDYIALGRPVTGGPITLQALGRHEDWDQAWFNAHLAHGLTPYFVGTLEEWTELGIGLAKMLSTYKKAIES